MKRRIALAAAVVLLLIALAAFATYVAKSLPADLEIKGEADPTAWIALATAVISAIGSLVSFATALVQARVARVEPTASAGGDQS